MTLGETLRKAAEYLGGKGVESPRLDAELLFAQALGMTRIGLYTEHDRPLLEDELAGLRELVARRGRREPLAYILGEWGFRRLTLRVDRRALIPRPETEILVERCLTHLRELDEPRVLDVGTGSGAIALAIADEHPSVRVTALDSSAEAVALAGENLELTGLGDRVELVEHNVSDGLPPGPWELVASNPPYVEPAELETLQPEIRDWEPRAALVGEGLHDGVARAASRVLVAAGWLVLEVGDGQADGVAAGLRALGYADVSITPDLTERQRVVEGRWP